jgi:hypothetical protein
VSGPAREAPPMMQCGHAANATQDGRPVCVICVGIVDGADRVDPDPPPLGGRTMVCGSCRAERPSDRSAAFFQARPDREKDSFYDGCRGWD